MNRSLTLMTAAAGTLALTAASAAGVGIGEELFAYSAAVSVQGLNGGTGWSTDWSNSGSSNVVAATGLSYSDVNGDSLVTSGKALEVAGNSPTDNTANGFRNVSVTGSEIWASTLIRVDGTGNVALQLRDDSGDSSNNDVSVRYSDGNFDIITEEASNDINVTSGVSTTGTYLMVMQIVQDGVSAGNDEVNFWVDPDIGGAAPAPTASMSSPGLSFENLNRVLIPVFDGTDPFGEYIYDEIRVGTSFADVTPIPEPGSAALVGLGALLVLRKPTRRCDLD